MKTKLTFLAVMLAASVAFAAPESASFAVGKAAPAFTAKNQLDKDVKLSDYAGKWLILYFYPRDDTPG